MSTGANPLQNNVTQAATAMPLIPQGERRWNGFPLYFLFIVATVALGVVALSLAHYQWNALTQLSVVLVALALFVENVVYWLWPSPPPQQPLPPARDPLPPAAPRFLPLKKNETVVHPLFSSFPKNPMGSCVFVGLEERKRPFFGTSPLTLEAAYAAFMKVLEEEGFSGLEPFWRPDLPSHGSNGRTGVDPWYIHNLRAKLKPFSTWVTIQEAHLYGDEDSYEPSILEVYVSWNTDNFSKASK